jgi:peptidoglycan/LPS O-acetylase OafA/YrhL
VLFKFLFDRLSRVTSSGKFIPQIDGLRFIAITLVLMFHLRGYVLEKLPVHFASEQSRLARLLEHGSAGVELFFIVSGFILAVPFASYHLKKARPVNLKAYFLRRLTRLEPPYIICLLLLFLLFIITKHYSPWELLPHLAAGLFYAHSLIYQQNNILDTVMWSLEIEVQFYLLTPLLTNVFAIPGKVRRRSMIVIAILLCVAAQWLLMPAEGWLRATVLNYLQYFLVGFLLADIFLLDWDESSRAEWSWDLVSLAGWPLLFQVWCFPDVSRWVFPLLAFLLYCAAFRGLYTKRVLSHPLLTSIGGMCYTIYLLHYPLIGAFGKFTARFVAGNSFTLNLLLQTALLVPIVLFFSIIYFLLIEKPCMRKDWPEQLQCKIRSLLPHLKPETSENLGVE